MRFVLNRIFKNLPYLYNLWQKYLNFIDKYYYDKNCNNYKIIPLGTYCLPRLIVTLNRLKPKKFYGEKTCPFDLAFFRNFEYNTELIENNFMGLFDNLKYDEKLQTFCNYKNGVIFIHEKGIKEDELKEIYKRRIENFWNYINDKSKYVYFLIAIIEAVEKEQIDKLLPVLKNYRDDFQLIIINQSDKKLQSFDNVKIIDLTQDNNFKIMNKKGDWAGELKKQKTKSARDFYNKLTKELKEIIKN